ncbi:MAG TPA: hypothetical protein EYP25_07840 [Anaerolineae bacterium]|nr:hypothetical protein [Anaerolineae bacterium]
MSNRSLLITILIVVVVIAAGAFLIMRQQKQPAEMPASAPAPQIPPEFQKVAEDAVNIIVDELGVSPDAVTVISVQKVTWRDASLGCPAPGMMYAQVLTPGYLITAEVNGQTQNVHMNDQGKGAVCPPERAKPPLQTE